MTEDPGGDLLWRFVQDDRDAFETLFRRYEGEVHGWALRIVREPGAAEEVVVETFWRANRSRATFDPSRSFGAWVRRIATNAACDHLRKAGPALASLDHDVPAPVAPDTAAAESVALAFRRLPPRLRVVATLALVEERPYAEIADALDLPVGTVKSRVFRAIRALRRELARPGVRP